MDGNPVPQMIVDAANKYGVDPDFALRIGYQESGHNANVRDSSAGAIGPMQLMPATAKDLGVNPRDTAQNIDGGVRYLRQMQDQFGGDQRLTAAAYNAGPRRVQSYLNNGTPLPDETTNYIKNTVVPGALSNQYAPTGKTPMADPTPILSPAAIAGANPVLFGGNPTPVGAFGAIGRMLGIGSEPELGRRLQNAGAGLISIADPKGAAALQAAANEPHYNVVTDALGNRYMVDTRTGRAVSGPTGGAPVSAGASPGGQAPGGGAPSVSAQLAQSPVALAELAKTNAAASSKKMETLDDAAAQAQAIIDQNNEAMRLSKGNDVIQGPGLWNMLKDKLAENTNGSLGGVDLAKQAALDKINSGLVASMLSAQHGVRFAAPEIKFGETASADREKPAAANQQIYSNNIQNAQRAIDVRDIARAHMAHYGVLGPEFSRDVQAYQEKHPVYQDTAIKSDGNKGPPGFKILSVTQPK